MSQPVNKEALFNALRVKKCCGSWRRCKLRKRAGQYLATVTDRSSEEYILIKHLLDL